MTGYSKVYMAGPMAHVTKQAADSWRYYVAGRLDGIHEMPSGPFIEVLCFNPTRGEETDAAQKFSATATGATPWNTVSGITGRDRHDLQTADIVFMNLLGAKRVSIGTTVELGWADAYRKPIVLVMEKSGNPHEHIFFQGLCTYRVDNLDSGIACAKYVLMPHVKPPMEVFHGLDDEGNLLPGAQPIPRRSF